MRIEVTNFKQFELFKVGNTQPLIQCSDQCVSFQITHDNLIICRACQVIGTSHYKDENSSENQQCFNRLWFIIMLWKHLSIIWRSFKTQSLISSLATTQIFYSHYNIVYSTIENQSQKKLAIKVLKQNRQGFTRYH